ncbi:MAG: chorismate mutase [Dehalococcoidia bacterium]
MVIRGIRGATTVPANTREAILDAARELLDEIVRVNEIEREHVASIIFTTTPDLDAEFPAVAAREAGWTDVALECLQEMNVPGALPRCLRLLMHVNSERAQDEITHVYLRDAGVLRPEFAADQVTEATP